MQVRAFERYIPLNAHKNLDLQFYANFHASVTNSDDISELFFRKR